MTTDDRPSGRYRPDGPGRQSRRRGGRKYGRSNVEDDVMPEEKPERRSDRPKGQGKVRFVDPDYEMFTREEIYTPPMEHPKGKGEPRDQRAQGNGAPKRSFWQKLMGWLCFWKKSPATQPSKPLQQQPPRRDRERGPRDNRDHRDNRQQQGNRGPREQNQQTQRNRRPNSEEAAKPAPNPPRPAQPKDQRPPRDRPEKAERPAPPALKPEDVNVPKLRINNLSFDTSESDLFDHFNVVAKVKNTEVAMSRETHRSMGYGFVTFESVEAARKVVAELTGKPLQGRALFFKPWEDRPQPRDREQGERRGGDSRGPRGRDNRGPRPRRD
jgi:hypothetical protein